MHKKVLKAGIGLYSLCYQQYTLQNVATDIETAYTKSVFGDVSSLQVNADIAVSNVDNEGSETN